MDQTLEQNYLRVMRALESVKYENKDTPVFAKALEWINLFPSSLDVSFRRRLIEATCKAFSMDEAELWKCLDGSVVSQIVTLPTLPLIDPLRLLEDKFRQMLPKGGWFEWYDEFTQGVEVPLSYSTFSSMCAIGASLGRRVYLRMGHFNIYPNYCLLLIGPPGLKKTTAGDIAVKLVRDSVLCPCIIDQSTPEALITALKASGHQMVYAGEMATFFGKEKYNAGMVSKLLRILDSPAEYEANTQARGIELLTNLAVTFLGCTTPNNLSHAMPEEVTSSGFMSRFLLIVERDTWREFHVPQDPSEVMRAKLMRQLDRLKGMTGPMVLSYEGDQWLKHWYHEHKQAMRRITDETMAEILVRTPTHMLRTAMLVHIVQCDDFNICVNCLKVAASLIAYTEDSAPRTVQALKQNVTANDMDYVISTLMKLGGAADHSTVIRRVANKMNSAALKSHIRTLEESGRIKVGKRGGAQYYILVQEGELNG